MGPWLREKLKTCECRKNTKVAKKPRPPLRQAPAPDECMQKIGIDFIGPFEKSAKGNKYILTALCHLSNFPEAKAVPSKEAKYVVEFLYELCCRYGAMEVIINDNEKSFTASGLMKQFKDEYGIDIRVSSVCFLHCDSIL